MKDVDKQYSYKNNPDLSLIRNKIRFGQEPDNPLSISLWLNQENLIQQKFNI